MGMLEIAVVFAVTFFAAGVVLRVGWCYGRAAEKRRWVAASQRDDNWLNDETHGDFIVMERGYFWRDYHNPLVRATYGPSSALERSGIAGRDR